MSASPRTWAALTIAVVVVSLAALVFALSTRVEPSDTARIPLEAEKRWAELLLPIYRGAPDSNAICAGALQAMADSMLQGQRVEPPVELHLSSYDIINAVALPANHVVLYRGLLKDAESENELAMVLAHELGHVIEGHAREHFRRQAVLTVAGGALAQVPVLGQILLNLAQLNELRHSREAEAEADSIGLGLLAGYYGHAGGATHFFERRLEEGNEPDERLEFLQTHPLSRERVDALREQAARHGLGNGPLRPPLPPCDGDGG